MDYYRVLNLSREPFSNSPDPDFFFHSRQHVACLQKIELSVRLRRGLNVVMGDVGTGKTTLCRQLIRKLADDPKLETHLLLDPLFSTPTEFLGTIAGMFSIHVPEGAEDSNWQLKEGIKNYLFRRGVGEGKTIALIIDEGQKLPDYCVEILRELLNYETNEFKLLQIVIFAQMEFKKTIADRPNFADRINYLQILGPLSFGETRAMIEFRLNQAKDDFRAPKLFTFPAYLTIYRASEGFPRKIIHLCHRVLLTMIVQNKSKADRALVRWCIEMLSADKTRRFKGLLLPALACLPAAALLAALLLPAFRERLMELQHLLSLHTSLQQPAVGVQTPSGAAPLELLASKSAEQPVPHSLPSPSVPPPDERKSAQLEEPIQSQPSESDSDGSEGEGKSARNQSYAVTCSPALTSSIGVPSTESANGSPAPQHAAVREEASEAQPPQTGHSWPSELGEIRVKKGDVLTQIVRKIYGASDPEQMKLVLEANPELKEGNMIKPGQLVRFPARPVELGQDALSCWYLQVAEKGSLQEALDLTEGSHADIPLRVLPCWSSQNGLEFPVVLQSSFSSETAAKLSLEKLPSKYTASAKVLSTRDGSKLFFAR